LGSKLPLTSPRFAGFSRELALEENLAKRVMGDSPAKRLALIARVAGARWAKGAKRILPIVSQLHEVWEKVRLNFRLITNHKSTKQTLKFA